MKICINQAKEDGSIDISKDEILIEEQDTWSLDITLAKIIVPALKQLKKTMHGVPILDDFGQFADQDTWNQIMDKMIWSFEQIRNADYKTNCPTEQDRLQEGLNLFAKYYMALWD